MAMYGFDPRWIVFQLWNGLGEGDYVVIASFTQKITQGNLKK